MKCLSLQLLLFTAIVAIVGCTATPKSPTYTTNKPAPADTDVTPEPAARETGITAEKKPAARPSPQSATLEPSLPSTSSPGNPSSAVAAMGPTLPAGEYTVLVESVPKGATVVVNGIPVGKAPQRVVLPGTARGFFRDQVSLKVRFIAADTEETSKTVEELLTPLDKIPAIVRFTTSGSSRVPR